LNVKLFATSGPVIT